MIIGKEAPKIYRVQARDREPLLAFMIDALRMDGCRILHYSPPNEAPFRITFETPQGERLGIIAYAFLANSKHTRNRPQDEHRFQIKYGSKNEALHELWQDPYAIYTTLFLGINPELGIFIGADPVLHSPTKFFISLEFKQHHVDQIIHAGWHAWERDRRNESTLDEPVEILVGGTRRSFLRYVRFEREAFGEDQGHRQWIAEQLSPVLSLTGSKAGVQLIPSADRLHELAKEFEMDESEVLDLIAGARRLKMAVRGWVAEEHLVKFLRGVPGVTECRRLDEEGGPDVCLRYSGSRLISLECKNVLRERSSQGLARLDFQRTRTSKNDPCSRYYSSSDFDIVAACLHAVSNRWVFQFAQSMTLDPHKKCPGKLSNLVRLDERWEHPIEKVLTFVANS